MAETCPFEPGDTVRYTPSSRGRNLDVMFPPEERLVVGETYVVEAIRDSLYVVVRDHQNPGGGIYWSEFSTA